MSLKEKMLKSFKENGVTFINENQVYFNGMVEDSLSDAAINWDEQDNKLIVSNETEELSFKIIPHEIPEKCIIVLEEQDAYSQIVSISHKLPSDVLKDIDKRATDWFAGGGKVNDDYIKQQLRYANHVIERT